jgi:hypothetical protein
MRNRRKSARGGLKNLVAIGVLNRLSESMIANEQSTAFETDIKFLKPSIDKTAYKMDPSSLASLVEVNEFAEDELIESRANPSRDHMEFGF